MLEALLHALVRTHSAGDEGLDRHGRHPVSGAGHRLPRGPAAAARKNLRKELCLRRPDGCRIRGSDASVRVPRDLALAPLAALLAAPPALSQTSASAQAAAGSSGGLIVPTTDGELQGRHAEGVDQSPRPSCSCLTR